MAVAPRIDSLSNHQVSDQERIFINGSGFTGATGVQVGSDWATDFVVDGDSSITVTLPPLAGGSTNWVIVHTPEGTSPCEGEAQLLTVAAPDDVPPGALRLDSIVPETVTLGRAEPYWLQGEGLSRTSSVILGSSACSFEATDDQRLMFNVPAELRGAPEGGTMELTVFAGGTSATLSVTVTAQPDAPEPGSDTGAGPALTSVEPTELGVDGGQVVVYGMHLAAVTAMSVGDVWCTVEETGAGRVVASVPSLAGYEGQSLAVCVNDGVTASGETDILITVTTA